MCSAKIRHKRRNDTVDFVPLLEKASRVAPIDVSVADRGFDSESNHVGAVKLGVARCIIRPRYENLQVRKTRGSHRKKMKRRFPWKTYHQRSKMEAVFSVIKRMFGDTVMSRGIVTQNREMMYRLMAYNCYRINREFVLILGVFYTAYSTQYSNRKKITYYCEQTDKNDLQILDLNK